MFGWNKQNGKCAHAREYHSRGREPIPRNMVRRHSPLPSPRRDEEDNGAWPAVESPPAPRRKSWNATRANKDRSRRCISVRRTWLRLRSVPPRSRWITAVCCVFFFGVLTGLVDDEAEVGPKRRQLPKPPPVRAPPSNVQQQRSTLSQIAPSEKKTTLQPKPVMVDASHEGKHGPDLQLVQALDIRAPNVPKIMDVDSENRKNLKSHKPRSAKREGCVHLGDWQESHHPTCSYFHEVDMNEFLAKDNRKNIELVNNGAYRDVWMIRDFDGTKRALKTLRYNKKRDFDPRNYERHRRDAVSLEQLSSSPYVADIYGFCGNSALADFSMGGDLYAFMESDPSIPDRLKVAYIVAASIADAHHLDEQGRATIAHTDIKPNQWILIDGQYVLNDFNRARLLTWDPERNQHCGFTVARNAGMWRSPEEYTYKDETEKVDVYSMGNVLYFLLTARLPFEDTGSRKASDLVKRGKRPRIDDEIRESSDAYHVAMVEAIRMCFEHNPKKRTGARSVADLLEAALDQMNANETI